MSHYCQFCDKEMKLEESVVYVKQYVTCGATSCYMRAKRVAKDFQIERERIEAIKEVPIIVYTSKTPEDLDSWTIIGKEDHPEYLSSIKIMSRLIDGYVVTAEGSGDSYCARLKSETEKYFKDKEQWPR